MMLKRLAALVLSGMMILCLGISASAIEIRIVTGDQDTLDVAVIGKRQFYLVNDEDDLRSIGTGKYPLSGYYMLNQDIELTKEWIPLGNDDTPFTGYFEGNGCTISNVQIDDEDGEYRYVGFIGLLADGGKLHNLTLKKISLRTARPANDVMVYYTAAAVVDGELSDCFVEQYEMEKMSQGKMTKWSGELLKSKSSD